MRQAVLKSLEKLANKNKKIIFIGSDLGPNVLKNFKKKHPDRFFMEGAAEQHIISMACGMAQDARRHRRRRRENKRQSPPVRRSHRPRHHLSQRHPGTRGDRQKARHITPLVTREQISAQRKQKR